MSSPIRPTAPRLTALAVVIVATYVVVLDAGLLRDGLHIGVGALLAAITWRGVRRLPPTGRRPWLLAAAGVTVGVVADLVTNVLRLTLGDAPFPTVAHLLFPVSHVLLALALLGMVRRGRRQDQASLLDTLIVTTSVGTLVWIGLAAPGLVAVGSTPVGRAHVLAYGSANLLLLVAFLRLALAVRRRSPAVTAVIAFAALHLASAALVSLLTGLDRYTPGSAWGVLWLGTHALLAVAVHRPGAEQVPLQRTDQRRLVAPRRAALLIPATLLLPATMLVLPDRVGATLLAAATTLVLLLIGARVWLLLTEVQEARDRDVAAQAQRDHRRFEALVRHAADVLLLVDAEGEVTYASPSATNLVATDPTGWHGHELRALIHPSERAAVIRRIVTGLGDPSGQPVRTDVRLCDRDGREQHVELVAVDLRTDPDVRGVAITLHEATERTALEHQLRHLAFHDPLTGLGNREMFREKLTEAIARTRRTRTQLALLMCDLDDFKDVNDTLGHAVGDRLLVEVARRLGTASRAGDAVVRLGGDEFAVLCEDIETDQDAVAAARRLLEATRVPITIDTHELRVGVSVGVVVDPGQRTGDELLRDADVALYAAKGQGKDRVALHHTTMTVQAHERLRLAEDLSRAIEADELDVAFQPIIDLDGDRIVGVEALARWTHPTRGIVAPSDFIPVAEQSGLVPRIGDLVLERTLAAIRHWQDAQPDVRLYGAVNLSARELREPDLVAHVADRLRHHRLDPSQLLLELTETGMLEDEALARQVMYRLRDHGVRFAVDDFGTGYSSLSYLRRLPVDMVKIDRSFIDELGLDTAADDLVRVIVELSHTLQLTVVAEGIETGAQRDILEAMGCRFAQGYLLGRPVDASAILHLLDRESIMPPYHSPLATSHGLPPAAS